MLSWFNKFFTGREILNEIKYSVYPPIFIRGLSRSGGTLAVTLLDAHVEIAMSYELYPNLLASAEPFQNGVSDTEFLGDNSEIDDRTEILDEFEAILKTSKNKRSVMAKLNTDKMKKLRVFVARVERAGIDYKSIADILRLHREAGDTINNTEDQLKLIERICLVKMNRENKTRWGMKCSNQFSDYLKVWPNAYFINIIRDGRDVLASQLNTGNFKTSPSKVGKSWTETHMKFHDMVKNPKINAYELHYEKLVLEPEIEIKNLCEFLKVPFSNNLLDFHQKDLSIYKNPTGHLSLKRISKPIDSSKIGRWESDLTSEQLDEYYSTARDAMITFGYLEP